MMTTTATRPTPIIHMNGWISAIVAGAIIYFLHHRAVMEEGVRTVRPDGQTQFDWVGYDRIETERGFVFKTRYVVGRTMGPVGRTINVGGERSIELRYTADDRIYLEADFGPKGSVEFFADLDGLGPILAKNLGDDSTLWVQDGGGTANWAKEDFAKFIQSFEDYRYAAK